MPTGGPPSAPRVRPWTAFVAALVVAAGIVVAAALTVDLTPKVDRSFFFASGSAPVEEARRIETMFDVQSQLVVVASAPDISSEAYRGRVHALTEDLADVPGVLTVKSLSDGPDDLEDARESPLWRRLILADGSATLVLALVEDPWPKALVPRVRELVKRHEQEGFQLLLAGVPYTVEVMQQKLVRDFTVFGAAAIVVFGLASLVLFRSLPIALGTLATCLAAVAATLLLLQAMGAPLGLLSANLVTIVFVLTQSHLVFLTSNWRRLAGEHGERAGRVRASVRETLRPSLASMVTTLLGFGTLLFVDAKPLRELGMGGVLGAGLAFATAYLIYPGFLLAVSPPGARAEGDDGAGRAGRWAARRGTPLSLGIVAACCVAGLGLARLETDPSLLAYFDGDGKVHRALEYLDQHGGSSPLYLTVRRADGESLLAGDDGYERLWQLQKTFEKRETVGRVLSLPVVLAEADRFPLSFLLSKDTLLSVLQMPLFDRVASGFVTEDRTLALFALQMIEHERERTRLAVIDELRAAAREEGYEVALTGGIYSLQGHLSERVSTSLVQSLSALAVLFTAIAWAAMSSLRAGLAMTAVLALVPVAVFGGMGAIGAPLDIVAAPAAAVGLGLAADAFLHLGVAARRAARRGDGGGAPGWPSWVEGRRSQWAGILRATAIVAAGFALFAFSSFPPTRRFGLAVAAATVLAAPLALVVLPLAASLLERGRRSG